MAVTGNIEGAQKRKIQMSFINTRMLWKNQSEKEKHSSKQGSWMGNWLNYAMSLSTVEYSAIITARADLPVLKWIEREVRQNIINGWKL